MAGYVSISWLGRIDDAMVATSATGAAESALESLLG